MSEFLFILNLKLKVLSKKLTEFSSRQLIQKLSFTLVISAFFFGGYIFFLHLFSYLLPLEDIGVALTFRLLSLSFLTFLLMLYLSNLVTSLSTLYRSTEVEFLMAKPVKSSNVFAVKFVESVVYSSWATLLAGIPLIFAFGASNRVVWLFYPLSALLLFLFVLVPAGVGIITLFLMIKLSPRIKSREIIFFLIILLGMFLFLFLRFGQPAGISISEIKTIDELAEYLKNLGVITSPFLPSSWMSEGLKTFSRSRIFLTDFIFYFLLLLSTALVSLSFAFLMADSNYYKSWTNFGESSQKIKKSLGGRYLFTLMKSLFVEKDLKIFFRTPTQWAQGVIFLALLLVYLGSLRHYHFYFTFPLWKILISFANFGFTAYILATLCVRFIFPTLSLEGSTFWLLRSAPISVKQIIFEKTLTNFLPALVLTEGLTFFSNRLLGVEPLIMVISLIAVGLMSLALVSLSVGLGAIFPDFKEHNPGKIASGAGGIITAVLSLAYVALSVSILAWPTYQYSSYVLKTSSFPKFPIIFSILFFLTLTLTAILLPLHLAIRNLQKRDF
ncbi:MAG: hypothetical protein AB1393_11455 [Candidatus Edwardsbacteria bacterium]